MNLHKFFQFAAKIAAHIMIILGLNLMTLLVIDVFFNQAMNFLGNNFFKYSTMIFILCGLFLSGVTIASGGKNRHQ